MKRLVSRASCAALAALALALTTPRNARADDDPLTAYRERFKAGLEKYKAGAVAEAIQYWEPIYRELGEKRGYRLAFNLARAYESFGDLTRAGERYQAFLSEVDARAAAGDKLDAIVGKEEKEARARLDELTAVNGRIKVSAGARPVSVRIDAAEPRVSGFVAYVAPGAHMVVLAEGTSAEEKREVTVRAGELKELTPAADEAPAPPAPTATPTPSPAPPPPRMVRESERPFPAAVLYVGAAATLVSVIVPVLTYESALSFRNGNALRSPSDVAVQPALGAQNAALRDDYRSRETTFYVTLAIPFTLAAATAALTGFYFAGSRERLVPAASARVTPVATPTRGGALLGLSGAF